MGLRSTFLGIVLSDLPSSSSIIQEGDARFDALMGGRTGNGTWGRYSRGYGTNCAVTTVGWLLDAQAPPDMLNAVAPGGSGFTPGAHFSRLNEGAKKRGWWKTPTRGQLPDLRPGDVYEMTHGPGGEHMGVVVSSTPSADGRSLAVETADGGQGNGAIKRQIRTFRIGGNNAVDISSASGSGWLMGWVALGGDEADEAPPEPPPLPPAPQSPDDGSGGAPGPTMAPAAVPVATVGPVDDGTGGAAPSELPYAPNTPYMPAGQPGSGAVIALTLGVGALFLAAGWYAYERANVRTNALSSHPPRYLESSRDVEQWFGNRTERP